MHILVLVLMVVGGLNWGLVGLGNLFGGNWNVINLIFGGASWLESLIYILVGLAALWEIFGHRKSCGVCGKSGVSSGQQGGVQ